MQFLSPEWIDAVGVAAADATVEPGPDLSIETVVEGAPMGDVTYHLAVTGGRVSVTSGPAPDPTVRFTQSYDTAKEILRALDTKRLVLAGFRPHGEELRVEMIRIQFADPGSR